MKKLLPLWGVMDLGHEANGMSLEEEEEGWGVKRICEEPCFLG